MDRGPDDGAHGAGAQRPHVGYGPADDARDYAGPSGVNGPYDALAAGERNGGAVGGQDCECAAVAGGDRRIGAGARAIARVIDPRYLPAVDLPEPGPPAGA